MKKTFNYISYCIYSFIPLYFALLGYTLVRQDNEDVILVLILILSSIFSLIALSNTRPTNIFVCSKEEVVKTKGIDYIYLVLMIILTFHQSTPRRLNLTRNFPRDKIFIIMKETGFLA